MRPFRLIARLDIKGPDLIKGVHLEGVRKLGDPGQFAQKYYRNGIDEIIYIDAVASLYGRNNLTEIVSQTARDIFIPLTVGGGLRSLNDIEELLKAGADKIAINTEATKNPGLISEIAERFGSQCVVLSIQAKRRGANAWEAYRDLGREHTGRDVGDWAEQGQELGAGEILLTSVDQEGTRAGFDLELVRAVSDRVTIPVIASGGFGQLQHLVDAADEGNASAVAVADALHYGRIGIDAMRSAALDAGLDVRTAEVEDI